MLERWNSCFHFSTLEDSARIESSLQCFATEYSRIRQNPFTIWIVPHTVFGKLSHCITFLWYILSGMGTWMSSMDLKIFYLYSASWFYVLQWRQLAIPMFILPSYSHRAFMRKEQENWWKRMSERNISQENIKFLPSDSSFRELVHGIRPGLFLGWCKVTDSRCWGFVRELNNSFTTKFYV